MWRMREIVEDLEFAAEWEEDWAILKMDGTGRRTGLVGEMIIWILDIVRFEVLLEIHMEVLTSS